VRVSTREKLQSEVGINTHTAEQLAEQRGEATAALQVPQCFCKAFVTKSRVHCREREMRGRGGGVGHVRGAPVNGLWELPAVDAFGQGADAGKGRQHVALERRRTTRTT